MYQVLYSTVQYRVGVRYTQAHIAASPSAPLTDEIVRRTWAHAVDCRTTPHMTAASDRLCVRIVQELI